MNLLTIFSRFPDQEACIEHLEQVRWGDKPACPHCGSLHIARKADGKRVGRWNCHDCKSSFNVLSKTVFEQTQLPLQKWFLAIGLVVNAKKGLSSYQLARDLELNQKSAWYMQQRIRAAMAADQGSFLRGIIEADETFLGGKPRKRNRRSSRKPAKRGRGTSKTAVVGAVERGGKVKAMVADDLSGRGILQFIQDSVDPDGSLLVTDEYSAYEAVRPFISHQAINHQERYSDRSGGGGGTQTPSRASGHYSSGPGTVPTTTTPSCSLRYTLERLRGSTTTERIRTPSDRSCAGCSLGDLNLCWRLAVKQGSWQAICQNTHPW